MDIPEFLERMPELTSIDGSGSAGSAKVQTAPSEANGSEANAAKPHKSAKSPILGIVEFIVAIIVFFLIIHLLIQPYRIPSGSMEDTIMTGDMVISEKVSYNFGEPKQGDIVTFIDPDNDSRTLIKRVIATGGQTVDLIDGDVYVDGNKLDEPYTDGKPSFPLAGKGGVSMMYPYTVPEGEVWVMGDNRTNSQDSRYFGSIPVSSVNGHAIFTYWPISSFGILE